MNRILIILIAAAFAAAQYTPIGIAEIPTPSPSVSHSPTPTAEPKGEVVWLSADTVCVGGTGCTVHFCTNAADLCTDGGFCETRLRPGGTHSPGQSALCELAAQVAIADFCHEQCSEPGGTADDAREDDAPLTQGTP